MSRLCDASSNSQALSVGGTGAVALTAEYGLEEGWRLIDKHMRDPQRFARNLARLLDGIEAEFQRR